MNPLSLFAESSSPITALLPLAQEQAAEANFVFSWFIVGLTLIVGVMLAVRPVKREEELKRERSMK